MLSFMASLSWQLGERAEAKELYDSAYEIFIACDDPSGAGFMLACVAGLQRELGDAEAAVATCERALEEFERAGMPLDAVIAMKAYVEALAAVGRRDVAELWAKRAAEHNRLPEGGLANPTYEIGILTIAARAIHLPGGDLESARTALEHAIAIADAQGVVALAAEAELALAETLHAAGDDSAAYQHLRRGQELCDEVARAAHDRRVRALRVRFELEQARRDAVRYREQAQAQAAVIAELERTRAELDARVADLQRLNAEVVHLSRTDPLTGIANRRFMRERLEDLTASSARYGTALAVAVFDVDWFKEINDRHGHETGDAVLVALTALMRRQFRSTDLPARLGGDEFVILMPGTGPDAAVAACSRLQRAVRAHAWGRLASGLKVSITIGVADGTGQADPEAVLRLADAALYRGKHAGRDTVSRH
jgi:diguanylate cyclase (GGDEF)-like protein